MSEVAERIPTNDLLPRVLATYGITADDDLNRRIFVDEHIDFLERADNEAIARTGFVLKRANEGFGLGYKVPLAVIAAGQAMLGIDLAVATPFLASNPAAFTAAAMGAIYYGYQALSETERIELHARIGAAIDFGVELVKNILQFCVDTMKELLTPETLAQLRTYISETAALVGTSLYEVTGRLVDRISYLASGATAVASNAATSVSTLAGGALERGTGYFRTSDQDGQGEKS